MKKLISLLFVFALCDVSLAPTTAKAQNCGSTTANQSLASHCDLTVSRMINFNPSTSVTLNPLFRDAVLTLSTTGSGAATYNNATGALNIPTVNTTPPGTNNATSYSAGTAYNLTTTPSKLDFGTTDPVVTIPSAGTYMITSNVRIDYTGLTNLAANTVSVKLRRTNNTAADLTNAVGDFIVPPVTLLTATGGDCDVNTVLYTTSNNNDVIELWGSRSASVSVGQIQAGSAWITAVRIY